MNTSDERDTHFQGFANLLEREISAWQAEHISTMESGIIYSGAQRAQEMRDIIAKRAYDLAQHVRDDIYSRSYELDFPSLKDVPDMEEWPPKPHQP